MQLLSSSFGAKRARLTKSFLSKDMLKIGSQKFVLPDDIAKSQMAAEQNEMTGFRMILIILLSITVVGLILAIPLYFVGKRKRVTMVFKSKSGETFTIAASNNSEANVLKKYAGIGIFD